MPTDAPAAAERRLSIPVDVPEPWAGLDLYDDLAHLLPLLVAQLATGVSRRTLERRLNRDWPPMQETTP